MLLVASLFNPCYSACSSTLGGVLSLVNGTLSAVHGYQDLPAPTIYVLISSNKGVWDVLRTSCRKEIIMAVSWAHRNYYTLIMF
jgi:hypothetical protein